MRWWKKVTLFKLLWFASILLVVYILLLLYFQSKPTTSNLNSQNAKFYDDPNVESESLSLQELSNMKAGQTNNTTMKLEKLKPSPLDNTPDNSVSRSSSKFNVVLTVVACGYRLHEALVMIKSAILFSTNVHLIIIIFAEESIKLGFEEKLEEWNGILDNKFKYEIYPVSFPENNKEEWRKLFKPCAAQRLFIPVLLKQYDSVLYVDTDTLFLTPLENIWEHFGRMNSSQLAALAPESEDPNTGWYNRFARHPYYGKLGVNSGVMLMNLTRMRQFGWEKYLSPIYKEFRLKITWGDQDILNIIFHYHPEALYVYSCRYNYRSDHCMYMSVCQDAHTHGVAVLHGSRGFFHNDNQPVFKAFFSAFEEYELGLDPYQNLLLPLENRLDATSHTNCGKVRNILTQNLHLYLTKEPFR